MDPDCPGVRPRLFAILQACHSTACRSCLAYRLLKVIYHKTDQVDTLATVPDKAGHGGILFGGLQQLQECVLAVAQAAGPKPVSGRLSGWLRYRDCPKVLGNM